MTERLPDTDEQNWADTLGAGDSTGGFLRVAHNDDGTLLAPLTVISASASPAAFTGPDAQFLVNPNGIQCVRTTDTTGSSAIPVFGIGTNVSAHSVISIFSANASGPIRFAGDDAWFVLREPNAAPTTGDLDNNECAIWFDAGVPSIKFLAESGETAEIILT